QTRDVSGTVKDEANAPLPGVSIVEKGTSNGTVTDSEGRFTIAVRDGAVLVVSFIGMKPQEVPVGNQSQLTISMESDVTELGEVVVVGYGEVDRKELTSSVSSLQARELKDLPINSAA